MEQRPASTTPQTTWPGSKPPKPRIDEFPHTPDEWARFASLPAVERNAVYLRSIRAMLVFFTVLTIAGLIVGVGFALEVIRAIHQSGVTPSPFGG